MLYTDDILRVYYTNEEKTDELRRFIQRNCLCTYKKGTGRTLKAGGAWIYDNEIDTISGDFENGDLVTVEDFDGYPLGHGFINTSSKLTVRMLSRKKILWSMKISSNRESALPGNTEKLLLISPAAA